MTLLATVRHPLGHIEPLEARIAPATLLIGAKGGSELPDDTEYVDHNADLRSGKTAKHPDYSALNFVEIQDGSVNEDGPNPLDQIALGLKGNAQDGTLLDATVDRYFYVRLHAGDSVVAYDAGYNLGKPLISVTAGDVIAVFTDSAIAGSSLNEYDPGEFTGLILGPGAKVQLNGGVNGDIVSALDTHKTATPADDTLDFKGLVSSQQKISNLTISGGAVSGGIFTAGSIDHLNVRDGSVQNVLAGTAANSHTFDLVKSDSVTPRFTSEVTYGAKTAGASITLSTFHDVGERVEAGAGGFGAKGGSLSDLTITADTDGFALIAGRGGDVNAAAHVTVGGAGGGLTRINVLATPDATPNSTGTVSIMAQGLAKTLEGVMLVAGDGGGSILGTVAAKGGAGGAISGVTAGFVKTAVSSVLSADSFHLFGGLGGNGKSGGAGGSITKASVAIAAPDVLGTELEVIAGHGGFGTPTIGTVKGGAGGKGGSVTTASLVSKMGSAYIHAGDAGFGAGAAAGGSITGSAKLPINGVRAAGEITLQAGSGVAGGAGGDIGTIGFAGATATAPSGRVLVRAGDGSGEDALAGRGGNITGLTGVASSLADGTITTQIIAGSGGGDSQGKASRAGGNLSKITITSGGGPGAVIVLEAGNAGNSAAKTGANGGSVDKIGLTGLANGTIIRSIAAGEGGTGKSKGGAGGSITKVFAPGNDIGYRTGHAFGYANQGGLFAGVGGAGAVSSGKNGSVTGITATSISSIVAGARNSPIPHLAEKVAGLSLSGTDAQLLLARNGVFIPDGDFVFTFQGQSTGLLTAHSSEAQIAAALNALGTIAAAGGVTVTATPSGGYSITFIAKGSQPLIGAVEIVTRDVVETIPNSTLAILFGTGISGEVPLTNVVVRAGSAALTEVQQIHVSGAASDTFLIRSGDQVTPELKLGATAEQVETALNTLPTIIGLGGVTVIKSGSDYFVIYNGVGAQALLDPRLLQKEKQSVDLSQNTGATTDDTLHSEYPIFINETTPGQSILLPFPDGNPQTLAPRVVGDAAGSGRVTVVTAGSGSVQEVDKIFFGQSAGTQQLQVGDQFILKYSTTGSGAATENSVVIPYTPNLITLAASVQAALNAMPLLQQGVKVKPDPNSPNAVLVTYNAQSAQVLLQTETYTPNPHPGGFVLNATSVNGTVAQAEVQTLDLDAVVARGGFFKLTFEGQSSGFIATSNNILRDDIAAQLHEISKVTAANVTVAETAPGSHIFTITFQAPGDRGPITGTAIVPESERIDVSTLTLDPTDEFTLSFRGDTTPILPQNANAVLIQAELNKLPSIQNLSTAPLTKPGSVRVFAVGPGTFRIDFPNFLAANGIGPDLTTPDLPNIVVASGGDSAHEIQHLDLRSLTAYADGHFRLIFNGETTYPLAQDATARDVEDALNSLFSVFETRNDLNVGFNGQVSVTQTAHGEFDIKFNTFGQHPAFTGSGTVNTDRFPIAVTQTADGAPAVISVGEQVSGAYARQPVIESSKGTGAISEKQRLDLSTFSGAGLGDFTITFSGDTTGPLTFTGNGVAPDASLVAQALNSLPSIRALNGNANAVTVTGTNGVYDVAFIPNGDQAALVVQARHPEVQQIDLGSLYSSANGEYVLDFGGQKTGNLSHDASASDISTALNSLPNVGAAGGVTVTQVASFSPQFTVTFGQLGDPGKIAATGGLTQEIQRIALGELAGRSDAQFRLAFNGQTTGLLSANLSPSALAAEIQTALNALETVQDTRTSAANADHTVSAIGQVFVSPGENGNFFVTFDARADVPAITGSSIATQDRAIPVTTTTNGTGTDVLVQSADGTAGTSEVQTIRLNTLTGANTELQLQFDNNLTDPVSGYTTRLLKAGANPSATAQTISNALNSLPSIAAAGGVTVSVNTQNTAFFDVRFNSHGNQEAISAAVGQHETQTVDLRALEKFHFTTDTTLDGSPNTHEEQLIDFTDARTDFTLQFGNDRTISLPANARIIDIEIALNALPSIISAGGVSVSAAGGTSTANHRIQVFFNLPGNVNEITGTADSADGVFRLGLNGHLIQALKVGLLDPNGPTTAQSLIDLTDALNALPEIKALRSHDQGTVQVSLVKGSYQIDFLGLGDQSTLTAGGTFSVEPTADIHRLTDGQASAAAPLPVFESTPGRAIGPVASTLTQGSVSVNEVQQLDLTSEFASGSGFVIFNFKNSNTGQTSVTGANPAQSIQNALNGLSTVQAVGTVTVFETAPGSHLFNVRFGSGGDQPTINADDTFAGLSLPVSETTKGAVSAKEVQKLDLNGLPSASFQVQFGGATAIVNLNGATQAANAAILDAALDNLGTIPGGVTVTSNGDSANGHFGTFTITFNNNGNVSQIGATSFLTTEAVMGGVTNEVQHLDLSALQGPFSAGSTFVLSFNGEATTPLSRFATPSDVQTALNGLPQFSAAAKHVTVTGANGQFDVRFADTVDHAGLILAQAGNQEIQHIDTTGLQGQGSPSYRLTFLGQQTNSIPTGASASQVEFELNQLPAVNQMGGVTVTQTHDSQSNLTGYDVQFNTLANQAPITGSVAVHEQLILDLHNLQNESGLITFTDGTNTSFEVPTRGSAFFIEFAINSFSSNPVTVTQLHPGVFQISYLNAGAPQPPLAAIVSKDGNSVRVPAGASATELESAIDNISISDGSLSGSAGLYDIAFTDPGDQIVLSGKSNVHEQLRTDIFAGQGTFHIAIGAEQTVELPAGATGDQIRLALNQLSAVQDLGGVRTVSVNPDSSFHVTFAGDYELPGVQFIARQNLLPTNVAEVVAGSATTSAVQNISYTFQGAFDAVKIANARFVGAIADFNEFDSNRFHFFDLVNTPGAHLNPLGVPVDVNNLPLPPSVATVANPFKEGDIPIDGLIMAKVIEAKTTAFTPEASLIANPNKTVGGTLFFDFLNNP